MSEQGQGSEGGTPGRGSSREVEAARIPSLPLGSFPVWLCCPHSSCSRCLWMLPPSAAEIPLLSLHFALLLENTGLGRAGGRSPPQNVQIILVPAAGSAPPPLLARDGSSPLPGMLLSPCSIPALPGCCGGSWRGRKHRGWCPADAGGSQCVARLCCSGPERAGAPGSRWSLMGNVGGNGKKSTAPEIWLAVRVQCWGRVHWGGRSGVF